MGAGKSSKKTIDAKIEGDDESENDEEPPLGLEKKKVGLLRIRV
jgi:hypothetical protein